MFIMSFLYFRLVITFIYFVAVFGKQRKFIKEVFAAFMKLFSDEYPFTSSWCFHLFVLISCKLRNLWRRYSQIVAAMFAYVLRTSHKNSYLHTWHYSYLPGTVTYITFAEVQAVHTYTWLLLVNSMYLDQLSFIYM